MIDRVTAAAPSSSAPTAERDTYLTARQLAERYQGVFSEKTLRNWRSARRGPQWVRLSGRVFYPAEKVRAWESRYLRRTRDSE